MVGEHGGSGGKGGVGVWGSQETYLGDALYYQRRLRMDLRASFIRRSCGTYGHINSAI